ncbi:MAG TPA: beta-N-acetylhexosaminidase [Methylomirabilota bacterium]|nr:beta-N-acetylhexosaminidase [Methylomirabilota bacterium]
MTEPAGGLLAVGFDGTTLPEAVSALAADAELGGVVLFARNCPTLEAVLALTEAAHALSPDILVLVDHEGGRVHRLPPPFTHFPPAGAVGRVGDPALAGQVGRAMARELRAAGFDSGLGPVLDCATDPGSVIVGDRAFGADPEQVAACGVAFVRALLAEGLAPVAKHFPGHGRTPLDSHVTLPEVHASAEELERVELVPFRRALAEGCPAVMVAHVRYGALDPERPASLSPAVIGELLRARLRFDGLVLSDDLEMQAVAQGWGVGPAAAAFLTAGGDLALVCRDAEARRSGLEAVQRALDQGALAPGRVRAARLRRRAIRALVRGAGPVPSVDVIGCPEHAELAAEVERRAGDASTAVHP